MEVFSIVMTSVTTILVSLIGYFSVRREQKDKQYKKLQEELAQQKQVNADKEKKERDEVMKKLSVTVEEITKDIESINDSLKETDKKVKNLSELTKYSLAFSTEINDVLVALGDTVTTDHPNAPLQSQMAEHRKKTSELMKNLYQITL